MKHEELAWVPMCVTDQGQAIFWHEGVRALQKKAREDFAKFCGMDWEALRKNGWRIVRVRLSHHS